ncbi:hypothetical protein RRG08_032362 [Elysia crispata]|uniref:Uncharacterized protein n=1 Tax=Elysia crispata TaxID=231223 RepID=A0AAE1AHV3_9GAST|nr:hypothetical protein RRG08_032362 [Elysia crispata]
MALGTSTRPDNLKESSSIHSPLYLLHTRPPLRCVSLSALYWRARQRSVYSRPALARREPASPSQYGAWRLRQPQLALSWQQVLPITGKPFCRFW